MYAYTYVLILHVSVYASPLSVCVCVCVCVCCTAHSSEVLLIVERANKEVAIEALLNTFEEVWLSRQLELVASDKRHLAINRQEVS